MNLLFDFLESRSTIFFGQSINLDTTASDEDPIRLLGYTENPSYHTISIKEFGSSSNMTLFACPDQENFVRIKLLHVFFLI